MRMQTTNYSFMYKKQIFWIGLGVMSWVIKWGLNSSPEWIEKYYSRALFPFIRIIIDFTLAWLPVPLIYLFFIVLIYLLVKKIRRFFQDEHPWPQKVLNAFMSTLAFVGGGVFFFLLLWGFNYGRVPIEQQLALSPVPLTSSQLKEELLQETKTIIKLREQIPLATDSALSSKYMPKKLENKLRANLKNWLSENGFPTQGRVRGRFLLPKGVFMYFGFSGLYWPFTGEGHVDAGTYPLQVPYALTHEMAHAYGFGDEGTCNFLAYLACSQSDDPFIAYAGHLSYWRTVASNYLQYNREDYRAFRAELPQGIRADLDAINKNLEAYPNILPSYKKYAYNTYLKTQGIKEGLKNYNRVIMLVHAWRDHRKI